MCIGQGLAGKVFQLWVGYQVFVSNTKSIGYNRVFVEYQYQYQCQALQRLATGSPEIPLHFRVIGMGVQPTVVSETLYSFSRDFGQRGTYIEVSFCCCSLFPTAQAISGIDVALWDLLGHLLKVPVCHLLGGSFRSIDVKAPNI